MKITALRKGRDDGYWRERAVAYQKVAARALAELARTRRYHLPGEHDQESHGNWADGEGGEGRVESAPESRSQRPTGSVSKLRKAEQNQLRVDIDRWKHDDAKNIARNAIGAGPEFETFVIRGEAGIDVVMVTRVTASESLHVVDLASDMLGGGTMLMLDAYRRAVKLGLPVTTSSTMGAAKFYRKMGMKEDTEAGDPLAFIIYPDDMRAVLAKYGRFAGTKGR
jgi:hypothetical protein